MKKTPSEPPARASDRRQGEDAEQVARVERDLHDEDHGEDPDERDQRRDAGDPIDLAEQHGVARDRRDEQLGGEVVLALLDEVRDAGDRALVQGVRDHPDQHERQVRVRQGAAQVLRDAAAQDAHEDDREEHGERERDRALDRPQDLAPGDREGRVDLRARPDRASRPAAPARGRWTARRSCDGLLVGAEELDVGLLEARVVDPEHGQRRPDPGDDRLGRRLAVGDADQAGRIDAGIQAVGAELRQEGRAIGGVEDDRALEEPALHARRACRSSRSGRGR